ncbi:MAG: dihydrofolate reductase [Thioalkalivibrionaceae bacterium]
MNQTSTTPRIELIVAIAENGVIGRENNLPWRLPDDLRHFRDITSGHTVIMGRNTWDSIGQRPLPNRQNIIVSSRLSDADLPNGVQRAPDLATAIARSDRAIAFVIGGARLFTEALPLASAVYLTRVHAHVEGDVHLPVLDALIPPQWTRTRAVAHPVDDQHALAFTLEYWLSAARPASSTD